MYQVPVFIFLSLLILADCSRFFHDGRFHGKKGRGDSNLVDVPRNSIRWFNQSLDHFDVLNLATWQQRYYVNDEFFDQEKRNVVFIMIGDESEATYDDMINGDWFHYANQSKALMLQLEHRFYGKSHPTEDTSLENLRYLTTEQALADLAAFVNFIKNEFKLSKQVKVIAFGGSYAGSLAAWARLKYPHLISGSVCTSGPLQAVPNFQDYFRVVADDLRNTGEECYGAIKAGFSQIDQLLQQQVGKKNLTQLFQLCEPLKEGLEYKDDVSNLYYNFAMDNFGVIAQYNKDNRLSTQGTLLGNITLDTICSIMTNTSIGQEITRLAEVNSLMLRAFDDDCFDYKYKPMIDVWKNASWEESQGGRQWKFQTCAEFGYFQTSDNSYQIFGDKFPFEFFVKRCIDIFGSKFDDKYLDYATRRTNTIYGGFDIEVSNVVFVHGSVDPWHTVGITSTQNPNAPAIYINGTAHCANMYNELETDPPQLKAARAQVGKLIQSWLK